MIEGGIGRGFSCPRTACYWTTGRGEETPCRAGPGLTASAAPPREKCEAPPCPGVVEGGVRAAPHASRAHTHLQGEGGARRRAARDDSQPSRTRCPVLGWPRRSVSHAPTSRQSKHSPGEVRRWLGSRVVHCLWPGPSAPSSQCVAGFGLPHFVPPLGAPPVPARPHSQQSGQAPPGRAIPPRGGTPSRVQSLHCIQAAGTPSRREAPLQAEHPQGRRAHPMGGAPRTSRHRHSPPGDLLPGGVRHGRTVSLRGEARPLHPEFPLGPENPSSLPQEVHPMEGTRTSTRGTPSSRGTLHTGEVGPTGGRNPRVRYEGGGWVGRGNRRGLRHPQEARFPFHSSRPRHPPRRHTMPPQNTQNTPPPPFPTHKTPHLYLHNPCSAHTKPPLQQ